MKYEPEDYFLADLILDEKTKGNDLIDVALWRLEFWIGILKDEIEETNDIDNAIELNDFKTVIEVAKKLKEKER